MSPLDLLNVAGGLVGGISGALGGGTDLRRIEEEYNRRAYGGLMNQQDKNNARNPEATRRAALLQLSRSRTAATQQAASAAAGQAATGGDVVNGAKTQTLVGSAVTAAGAPIDAQAAQVEAQKAQDEAQQINQGESISNSIAGLSNHVSYLNQQKRNPLKSILEGTLAGLTAGHQAGKILDTQDIAVDPTKNVNATQTVQPAGEQYGPQTPTPAVAVQDYLSSQQPVQNPQPGVAPSTTTPGLPVRFKKRTQNILDILNGGQGRFPGGNVLSSLIGGM